MGKATGYTLTITIKGIANNTTVQVQLKNVASGVISVYHGVITNDNIIITDVAQGAYRVILVIDKYTTKPKSVVVKGDTNIGIDAANEPSRTTDTKAIFLIKKVMDNILVPVPDIDVVMYEDPQLGNPLQVQTSDGNGVAMFSVASTNPPQIPPIQRSYIITTDNTQYNLLIVEDTTVTHIL